MAAPCKCGSPNRARRLVPKQGYGTTHRTRQIASKKRGNLGVSGSGSFSVKIDLDVCQHLIFNEAGKNTPTFQRLGPSGGIARMADI